MTPEVILDIFRQAVFVILMMVVVLILPGLITGLIVAMFQAATQINEMSLSFIPKLLVTFIALGVTGTWLLKTIVNYARQLMLDIPTLIG